MTLYFCLSVPSFVKTHFSSLLHEKIIISDANEFPIGKLIKPITIKGNWESYILRTNFGSERLCNVYRSKLADDREILYSSLSNIFALNEVISISFMAHTFKGYLSEEVPIIFKKVKVPLPALHELIFSLEEDVLYHVHKQYPFI